MKKFLVVFLLVCLSQATAAAGAQPGGAAAAVQQEAAPAQPPANKPHLIVSAFTVDPQPVEPGVNFTLTVDILNTSKKKVENLLVSIGGISTAGGGQDQTGGAGPTFATRTTGNSRFIGPLEAGATAKASFELAAAPKADPGLYLAQIDLNYINEGRDFTSSQDVGVSVSRSSRFEFQSVSIPAKVIAGKRFPVSFEAVNSAGFTVQGVTLSFVSAGLTIEDGDNIVGALESGDSDTLEAKARAEKPGPVTADLVIKYRDDFNRDKTATRTVEISVSPKPTATVRPDARPQAGGFWQSIGRFFKALFGIG